MKMPPNVGKPPEKSTWIIQNNLSIGPGGTDLPLTDYTTGQAGPRHVISHNAYNAAAANAPCRIGRQRFPSLDEMREATGFDQGSLFADGYTVFQDAPEPPHTKRGTGLLSAESVDLRLRPEAKPVDAGIRMPGINDDFSGDAPDIGAYETGKDLPVYGPRKGPYLKRLQELRTNRPETEKSKSAQKQNE